jgi:hypothetical protein
MGEESSLVTDRVAQIDDCVSSHLITTMSMLKKSSMAGPGSGAPVSSLFLAFQCPRVKRSSFGDFLLYPFGPIL